MKRFVRTSLSTFTIILMTSFLGAAQDKSRASKDSTETEQTIKTTTDAGTKTTSSDRIYGKIESYEAGKSLKITVPGKLISTKTFDLNSKHYTYHLAPDIKVGQWVTVIETTDNEGHKMLTVEHSNKGSASRSQ